MSDYETEVCRSCQGRKPTHEFRGDVSWMSLICKRCEAEPDWRAMLERYGGHHLDCYWLADGDPSQGCNCGWQRRVHEHDLDVRLGVPPLEGIHATAHEREDGRWSAAFYLNGGYGMAVRSSLGLAMREALNGAIEDRVAKAPMDTREVKNRSSEGPTIHSVPPPEIENIKVRVDETGVHYEWDAGCDLEHTVLEWLPAQFVTSPYEDLFRDDPEDKRFREARLEEIQERWAKATDGPWQATYNPKAGPAVWTDNEGGTRFRVGGTLDHSLKDEDGNPQWDYDLRAVRAAPKDISWLLSEIDRLKAKQEDPVSVNATLMKLVKLAMMLEMEHGIRAHMRFELLNENGVPVHLNEDRPRPACCFHAANQATDRPVIGYDFSGTGMCASCLIKYAESYSESRKASKGGESA